MVSAHSGRDAHTHMLSIPHWPRPNIAIIFHSREQINVAISHASKFAEINCCVAALAAMLCDGAIVWLYIFVVRNVFFRFF